MQTRNRLFDDIAKVANSAAGTLFGLKDEIENMVRHRVEGLMTDMNMVTRDEFDAVKAMAAKARSEQERLKKKIKALEEKVNRASKYTKNKPKKATKPNTLKNKRDSDTPLMEYVNISPAVQWHPKLTFIHRYFLHCSRFYLARQTYFCQATTCAGFENYINIL